VRRLSRVRCTAALIAIFIAVTPAYSEEVSEVSLWSKPRLLDGDWRNDLAGYGISFDA
jgi:hypothetical protein